MPEHDDALARGWEADAALVGRVRSGEAIAFQELFSQYLGTRVSVAMGPRKGKVVIDFADLEDLERIYRTITEPQPSTSD